MNRKISNVLATIFGAATLAVVAIGSQPAAAQDASSPYIGTIRYFGFNFAPRSWAHCDGQLIAVSQNEALFSLVGTTYGGDGRTTFGLPDMRGRLPVHQGTGPGLSPRRMGQRGGATRVALNANQIGHGHTLRGSTNAGNQSAPTNHALAQDSADNTYKNETPSVQMHPDSVGDFAGGGQQHQNMPPYLGVYCNIALLGVYPSRN